MFFGLFGNDSSSPPPAIQLPPVPTPKEMKDVLNTWTGMETIKAIDPATGKERIIRQELPRSRENQEIFDIGRNLMIRSSEEMQRLAEYDPSQIVEYAPYVDLIATMSQEASQDMQRYTNTPDFTRFIDNFQNMRQTILDKEFKNRGNELQEGLTRRGYGNDSTASTELKMALATAQSEANERLKVDSEAYGRQLYDQDLASREKAYNLTEATRQNRLGYAQGEYALKQDNAQAIGQQKQKAFANQRDLYGMGAGIVGADDAKKMSSDDANIALAEFGASNANQLNYYNANINRLATQHRIDTDSYNNRPPSLGQALLTTGATVATHMLRGPTGEAFNNFVPRNNRELPANMAGVIRR